MARFSGQCWKCGELWEGDSQPGRAATCSKCDRDLHVCLGCRHHDPNLHNQCKISGTDLVRDRNRANFCEQFEIIPSNSNKPGALSAEEAKKRLERLFGG